MLISLLALATLAFLITLVFFVRALKKNRTLENMIREKEARVESTSKTLLEKHFELMDTNERLNKMLQTKSDFIGVASHQLRTPLTDIRYGLLYLLDGKPEKLNDAQHTHVQTILAAVERMNGLINELLDYVRSEEGEKSHRLVESDIDAYILRSIKILSDRFKHKNISVHETLTFHSHGNGTILVDESLLGIAITNLISNALQYTPEGKSVFVRSAHQDNAFYFEVVDEGVGIPKERQNLIFGKFKRSDAALEMNAPGIGLGLHITKKIITGMNGDIGFESDGVSGSKFYFTLPIKH